MTCDNRFSCTWLAPLVLALLSSLLAWDNINTWDLNRSTIASLERARSDLRLEMDDSQAEWSTLIGPDLSRYSALIGGTLLCWRQGLCHNNTPKHFY